MGKPQFIRTDAGDELVVLSRRDYDALLAGAGDADAEDRMTAAIVADTSAAIARGEDSALPATFWDEKERTGKSQLRDVRRYRGMTQEALAAAAGIEQGYISALETGDKKGSAATLMKIARILGAEMELLVDD